MRPIWPLNHHPVLSERSEGPFENSNWMSPRGQNPTRALQQTTWTVAGTYSITSSARSRNASGITKPSTFAVSRLMTSLEFGRPLDGISSGLEPPQYRASRQKRRRSKGLRTSGQFYRLNKGATRHEVLVGQMTKSGRELCTTDAGPSHNPLVGHDAASRLLHKRDMCGMRCAVGRMPPPSNGEPPECIRARPVTIPFGRNPNRLQSDLMRHDSPRFQPTHHFCVDSG